MKKNSTIILGAFILFVGMTGCKKYLDIVPQNVGTLDYAFRNRSEAEKYLFTCYSTLQQRSNMVNDPWFATGGELVLPQEYLGQTNLTAPGLQLVKGGVQNKDNPVLNYWDGSGSAPGYYDAIRRCNTFLENVDKPIDLQSFEKERWIAEAKFLKAYYHFFLAKMYGPIPMVKNNTPVTAPTEETRPKRDPVDSVLSYVVQLLDEAADGLPIQIDNPDQELGRITRVIALSLKAEVLVAQASPLFNGNPDYAGFKNKDGSPLFSSTPNNALWAKAAQACKDAIDLAESVGLGLYTYIMPPNIPANLSDSLVKEMNFRAAITETWDKNKELVWALNGSFGWQQQMFPKLVSGAVVARGQNTIACPFSVTDLFYTRNGVPIEEDNTWDYANRFSAATGDASRQFYIKQGYETIKNNFDREVRYYASFGFDGGIWFGNAVYTPAGSLLSIQGKGASSISGVSNAESGNVFGIWPKKLCNYLTVNNATSYTASNYRLPLIRMADLYLLYAECLNEANGPSEEVYHYLDMVRARTGLKGIVESWARYSNNPGKPLTRDGLRQIIHRERRIELCMEGKAGWDLRRWKEYLEVATRPIQGWTVSQTTTAGYYQLTTFYVPSLSIKDYLWPISSSELLVNQNLVQNPYW
ncbi:RagB/SusD family nutrient uptake outer membrane protein [Niabella sp. CC-SYL272]|uniref:RagB/SusD family nutrient uptake outer membrane protein n=1 Tax=Niabella agricola TaxID=2891571 RepID=UPI001F29DC51|nr:RagB/SusD family nutrient uptake outer membrane protein [Niabella agricola]MCF3111806.1 RagB/SusD family nutrient uptake outer membrane protein [Niabella agricola]